VDDRQQTTDDAQIKRVADSKSLNIAEGSTGQSNPEQKKFLGYSQRFALEVVTCLYLGKRRNLITEINFKTRYDALDKLAAMIQKFKIHWNKTTAGQPSTVSILL